MASEPSAALATAQRAIATAERYGEALVRISEIINDERLTDAKKIRNVRIVLAGLDQEADRA